MKRMNMPAGDGKREAGGGGWLGYVSSRYWLSCRRAIQLSSSYFIKISWVGIQSQPLVT